MSETSEDRTETATPKRLQTAREDGDLPLSRELPMLLAVGAGLAVLAAQLHAGPTTPSAWLTHALSHADGNASASGAFFADALLWSVIPVATAAAAAMASATFLQTGFLLRTAALQPDIGRVSPLKGLKRLFGIETLAGAAKAVGKLAVLVWAFWFAMGRVVPLLVTAPLWQPGQLYRHIAQLSTSLVLLLLGAQAVIAGADILFVRLRYARRLRMSRHEVREEAKDTDGNPQVKQRLRQLTRARARRRMMAAIPRAAVIVTNPTHYAIALNYERGGRGAPRVVAKGADEIATRIRELAREHRIPLVANPPLARALYRIEIDTEIPAEHFKAVAEIIAYVWRLRSRPGRL